MWWWFPIYLWCDLILLWWHGMIESSAACFIFSRLCNNNVYIQNFDRRLVVLVMVRSQYNALFMNFNDSEKTRSNNILANNLYRWTTDSGTCWHDTSFRVGLGTLTPRCNICSKGVFGFNKKKYYSSLSQNTLLNTHLLYTYSVFFTNPKVPKFISGVIPCVSGPSIIFPR